MGLRLPQNMPKSPGDNTAPRFNEAVPTPQRPRQTFRDLQPHAGLFCYVQPQILLTSTHGAPFHLRRIGYILSYPRIHSTYFSDKEAAARSQKNHRLQCASHMMKE